MKYINTIIDIFLPDYRRRHIFTTKLRLVAFIGFWAIFLFFLRDVLSQAKGVAITVFACFLVTGFAYYNIMKERWLLPSFFMELICDLTAITVIIYLTGGPYSPYYTIYLFYVFVTGAIYNHYLAAVVAFFSALFYGAFQLLCHWGVMPPLIFDYGDKLPPASYTPFAHFLFALIFLAAIIYTVKVAIYFSQQREIALEKRNRELMALHRMSSTVRSVIALRDVIDKLLAGVLEGLGFKTVLLLHFDRETKKARLYTPRRHPRLEDIERALGKSLEGMEFPIEKLRNSSMRDIMDQHIIFRDRLADLVDGLSDLISAEQCDRIQELIGVKRIVAIPLVIESQVLGTLIGLSSERFLEDKQVATLESFANQAAMSLEAASIIEKLKRVNEELKEANEVKSEFLATMSHELRTPLTAIIGFSELLMEGVMGDLTEEQQEGLQEVLHNAADLLEMINSLLDLTKIESGRVNLEIGPFDIEVTLNRVSNTIAPLIHKRGQEFVIEVAEDVPPLSGDERKIQQAILNLLANANKFTPEGGSIRVTLNYFGSLEELGRSGVEARHLGNLQENFQGGGVEIVVQDDGVGIPPDHLDRIFEMFHQADSSVTRNFGGTGLGLALARRFVEMHGGTIWVESELGKGASFTVILPISSV